MMLLKIENLSVGYADDDGRLVPAVDDVSLELDRGEVLGLVGESGCGKSTVAMAVPRLLPMPPARITGGRILLDGEDILAMPPERLRAVRGARIGVIFQDPMGSLSPLHRIGDQLAETARLHGAPRAAARDLARGWLGKVGLPEAAARAYPHELSGGMQQRVMIAMALMLEPDLVVADEPTTALDVTVQAQVLRLMRKLRRASSGVLLITHDLAVVSQMATRLAVMYAGQVVETADDAAAFFRAPRHPYSRALLRAIPSAATRGRPLAAIPGSVPPAGAWPSGCRFRDRCAEARPDCAAAPVPLAAGVRCHLPATRA